MTPSELDRYARQVLLPGFGPEAQERLAAASAIVVGAGALGAPAAAYLAGAGVGRIGVVDDGTVEVSNLHRQALHFAPEIGANKAESAARKLAALNPEVQAEPYPVRLEPANAVPLVSGAGLVIDGSNDPETRATVNDACCEEGVPLVTGSVLGLAGAVMSILPGRTACWRCALAVLPPEPPAGRVTATLGAMAGIVGSAQALEALKLLAGAGEPVTGAVVLLDGRDLSRRLVEVDRDSACPVCGREAAPQQSI